ncbi:MAG: hypothetical protein ACLQIQ_14685 [Beijerinckiaceae bacterium]
MDAEGAVVFVTKAAAARRQLDAAIRFWFAEEDDLAVHTVAAAAYRILRDLMQQRGLQPFGEFVRVGLFNFAKAIAEGQEPDMPDDAATRALINGISEEIKAGRISSYEDIDVTKDAKQRWKEYAFHSSFLKHADTDPDARIIETEIDNAELLLRASGTYVRLFQDSSAEMMLLYWHSVAVSDDESEGPNIAIIKTIRDCKPELRRKTCLAFLPAVRKEVYSQH